MASHKNTHGTHEHPSLPPALRKRSLKRRKKIRKIIRTGQRDLELTLDLMADRGLADVPNPREKKRRR